MPQGVSIGDLILRYMKQGAVALCAMRKAIVLWEGSVVRIVLRLESVTTALLLLLLLSHSALQKLARSYTNGFDICAHCCCSFAGIASLRLIVSLQKYCYEYVYTSTSYYCCCCRNALCTWPGRVPLVLVSVRTHYCSSEGIAVRHKQQ